jgi:TonB family protein
MKPARSSAKAAGAADAGGMAAEAAAVADTVEAAGAVAVAVTVVAAIGIATGSLLFSIFCLEPASRLWRGLALLGVKRVHMLNRPAIFLSRFLLLICCSFGLSLAVCAQQEVLGARAADVTSAVKQHPPDSKVLVCDFDGPNGLTALGIKLADDFSGSISRAGGDTIKAVDRSQLPVLLRQVGIERERADSELQGEIAAERLTADDFVAGNIALANDGIDLHLGLYRAGVEKPVQTFEVSFPLDGDMRDLLQTQIHDTPQSPLPYADSDGYSSPRCAQCPSARYTRAAAEKKIQGRVVLLLFISADGKVTDVHVLKGLPDGLTDSSVAAAKTWQLKPATDFSGKPAAVRQIVEMDFHSH